MFKRNDFPKRRRRGVGAHRILMSMVMITILGLGVLQALKGFSGIDPLKISPQSLGKNILSSDSAYNFLTGLLTFSPKNLGSVLPSQKKGTVSSGVEDNSSSVEPTPKPTPRPQLLFSFALLADSHTDIPDLQKAVSQINETNPNFVIGLGDYSDVGTVDELRNTKKQFDLLKEPYYILPGDHDLWDSLNKGLKAGANFNAVFGQSYQAFTYQNIGFLLIDDSNNYDGIDKAQAEWINSELQMLKGQHLKDIFVFTHIPLYHPSSDHVVGKADPDLVKQADYFIDLFKKQGVSEVIAGDIHFFSQYTEPKTGLKMTTIGAVTSDRNLELPRFATVDVYSDGSYNIKDTQIK